MSLEALIDLWKIPKEDAYRILGHNKGDFIPVKFYYGDAAFRLLDKKEADVSQYDDKKKQYYINTITQSKKYRIAKEYFDDLIKRASYRDYEAEKRKEVKLQELKNKSLIVLDTTQGEITVQLFPEKAPLACENFIALAEKNYYNGIIFHRVIKGFMIQGGDPTGTGTGGNSIWEKPFQDEVSADLTFNKKGLLAMANSGPNTNGSQFFITTKETPWLNGKHTIFGEVISGYDVVEKIENVAKDSSDKPKKEQKIIKAYIKTGPSLI
ncbi:MAG: peptidylprolyl isomerase [Candidatus Omnitrophica bacterium]|nr:peptidylprolyl isomerase [Candidatus Omnitrophota bacterium]